MVVFCGKANLFQVSWVNFLPSEILLIKKLEIEKNKSVYISVLKVDVGLVFSIF